MNKRPTRMQLLVRQRNWKLRTLRGMHANLGNMLSNSVRAEESEALTAALGTITYVINRTTCVQHPELTDIVCGEYKIIGNRTWWRQTDGFVGV